LPALTIAPHFYKGRRGNLSHFNERAKRIGAGRLMRKSDDLISMDRQNWEGVPREKHKRKTKIQSL